MDILPMTAIISTNFLGHALFAFSKDFQAGAEVYASPEYLDLNSSSLYEQKIAVR